MEKQMVTFKDLVFEDHNIQGIKSRHKFDNGFEISVVAGEHMYPTPKKNLESPEDYSSFEVGVFDNDGEWATHKFLPNEHNDVVGWQERGDINSLMLLIQSEDLINKI